MGDTSRAGRNRIQSIMVVTGESTGRSTVDGSVAGEYF